jgi:hypothetical protein
MSHSLKMTFNVLINKEIDFSIVFTDNMSLINNNKHGLPATFINYLKDEENMNLSKKYNIDAKTTFSRGKKTTLHKTLTLCTIATNITFNDTLDSSPKTNKRKRYNEEEEEKEYIPLDMTKMLAISKHHYCVLHNQMFPGAYYAFLMSHDLKNKKKDTNIGFSKDPVYSLYLHNEQRIVNKNTSSAAPHWKLDTVLGPFSTARRAELCCDEWVTKTRGKDSKQTKGFVLHKLFSVNLYSCKIKLNEPFDQFLCNINAPKNYIDTTRKLYSIKNMV